MHKSDECGVAAAKNMSTPGFPSISCSLSFLIPFFPIPRHITSDIAATCTAASSSPSRLLAKKQHNSDRRLSMIMLLSSSPLAAAYFLLLLNQVNGQIPGFGGGGGGGDGPPFGGSGDGPDGGPSSTPSQSQPLTGVALRNATHILAAHAILACLAWILFIPFGGIILRLGIRSPWVIRIHAACQVIAYGIYLVAAGMGVWLARQFSGFGSIWSNPHPILGVVILVAALVQPISGLINHQRYKRRLVEARYGGPKPGRSGLSRFHIAIGRILIVMAVVNGGLGLRLAAPMQPASTTKNAKIIYAVLSAWMLLLYLGITLSSEWRTATGDGREGNVKSKYNEPPSYNESEDSVGSERATQL